MIKKTLLVLLLATLVLTGTASAQEDNTLPEAGTLPGSPFYFLDLFGEGLGTFFTFGNSAKAAKHLAQAEERLAEAKALAEEGESERAEKAAERYEKKLEKALQRAEKEDEDNREKLDEVLERIAEATVRHQLVLAEVYGKVPEQTQPAIERAIENSSKGHNRALEAISDEHEDDVRDRVHHGSESVEEMLEEMREAGIPIPEMSDKREEHGMDERHDDDDDDEFGDGSMDDMMEDHMDGDSHSEGEHMSDDTVRNGIDDDCDGDTDDDRCDSSVATSADNAPDGSLHNLPVPEAVSAVRAQVATELGIDEGLVIVMEAHEKTWTNGCLDLARADEECTEALVPGYEVKIQAQGTTREFRTNRDGTQVREDIRSKGGSDDSSNKSSDGLDIDSSPASFSGLFREELSRAGVERVGQPIEGFDSYLYLKAFPGLVEEDFDGVETFEGIYNYYENTLLYERKVGQPVTSAEQTISNEGYDTLLTNLSKRLGVEVEKESDITLLLEKLYEADPSLIDSDNNTVDDSI